MPQYNLGPVLQNISSNEAWAMLQSDSQAQLVDVRTVAEWKFVGLPDLEQVNREPILIEYQSFPSIAQNPQFLAALEQAGLQKNHPLLFLCRTGGRSHAACVLAEQAGFTLCFNIADGFEGALDAQGHRGGVSGWKASALPWRQG